MTIAEPLFEKGNGTTRVLNRNTCDLTTTFNYIYNINFFYVQCNIYLSWICRNMKCVNICLALSNNAATATKYITSCKVNNEDFNVNKKI